MADTFVGNLPGEKLVLAFGATSMASINTTRSLDLSAKASTTEVADVTNPSNPAKTVRQIMSTDLKFSGDGVADGLSTYALMEAMLAGAEISATITQNVPGAQGGFTITGPLVITAMSLKGARGEMQTFTITCEAADAFTVAANA